VRARSYSISCSGDRDARISNDEIRASLSPEQLIEYERALTGFAMTDLELLESTAESADTKQPSSDDQYRDLSSSGCLHKAYLEHPDAPTQKEMDLLFSDALSEMLSALDADPQIVELEAEWARCMATAGYQYTFRHGAFQDVQRQAAELKASVGRDALDPHSSEARRMFARLKLQEIEIAVADWECSRDFEARYLEVSRRHEIDFIYANEGQILAILDERESRE